jgi:hypothetical protein
MKQLEFIVQQSDSLCLIKKKKKKKRELVVYLEQYDLNQNFQWTK